MKELLCQEKTELRINSDFLGNKAPSLSLILGCLSIGGGRRKNSGFDIKKKDVRNKMGGIEHGVEGGHITLFLGSFSTYFHLHLSVNHKIDCISQLLQG